jgi:hypothetical protein
LPLLALEKESLSVQAAHLRLDVVLPASDMPELTGQVRQVEQAVFPAEVLKVPFAHCMHVRSDDAVAASLSAYPGAHGGLTCMHMSPLSLPEKVVPVAHGAQ